MNPLDYAIDELREITSDAPSAAEGRAKDLKRVLENIRSQPNFAKIFYTSRGQALAEIDRVLAGPIVTLRFPEDETGLVHKYQIGPLDNDLQARSEFDAITADRAEELARQISGE